MPLSADSGWTVVEDDPRQSSPQFIKAKVDEGRLAFDREKYEQFRKEVDSAEAEFQARLKDIKPYMGETVEGLRQQILAPVLDKWGQVPGFEGSASGQGSLIKAKLEAQDAARQLAAQQRYQSRFQELMKSPGMTPTQAAMTSALENADLVFSGHASALAGEAAKFKAPFDPTKAKLIDLPGTGHAYAETPTGFQIIPKTGQGALNPVTKLEINRLQKRLEALQKIQDEELVAEPKQGEKVGAATQQRLDSRKKRQKEIDDLDSQIKALIHGAPLPEVKATTEAPATPVKRYVWTPQGLKLKE